MSGTEPNPNPINPQPDQVELELQGILAASQEFDTRPMLAHNRVNVLLAEHVGPTFSDTPEVDDLKLEAIADKFQVWMDEPTASSEADAHFIAHESVLHRTLQESDVRDAMVTAIYRDNEGESQPDAKKILNILISEDVRPGTEQEGWQRAVDEALPEHEKYNPENPDDQRFRAGVLEAWKNQKRRTKVYEVMRRATKIFDLEDKNHAADIAEVLYMAAYSITPNTDPGTKATNLQYFEELCHDMGSDMPAEARQKIHEQLSEIFD